jgi:hypothetical protein
MFEVTVTGDGLEHLGIDAPPAAAKLMDKGWRDRAEFEVGGIEAYTRRRPGP